MAFKISCPGCGQSLLAEEAWIGKKVKCPSCQVPFQVDKAEDAPAEPDDADDDDYRLADEPDLPSRGQSTDTSMVQDSPENSTEAPEGDAKETECPACGVKIAAGDFECRSCRYNIQLGRRVDVFTGSEHYAGTVGFERYLLKRLHQTESLVGVMIWFHVAFVFALGITCLVVKEWWIAIPVVVMYLAYHLFAHGNRYFYRGKSFLWWLFLRTGRILRWRRLGGMKKRKAWVVRDPSFNDERLALKSELEEYHVIDLQGTSVSDEGLRHLEFIPILEFVILKNTDVTEGGVAQLQSTNPDACIWY